MSKDPILLENGDVYHGDWDENHKIYGRGVMYHSDGSLSEGY